MKTKQDTDLISIEHVQEIIYAESNWHVTDDVTRPYAIIVVSDKLTTQHAYYVPCRLVIAVYRQSSWYRVSSLICKTSSSNFECTGILHTIEWGSLWAWGLKSWPCSQ